MRKTKIDLRQTADLNIVERQAHLIMELYAAGFSFVEQEDFFPPQIDLKQPYEIELDGDFMVFSQSAND